MYPALITAAFFTGVFLNDLIQKQPPMELTKHLFFGILCVGALWALDFGGKPWLAWGLLIVPTLALGIGIAYFLVNPIPKEVPIPLPLPAPKPAPEPKPEEPTVIQNPDALYACVEMDFSKKEPTGPVIPSCDVAPDGSIGMPGSFPCPVPEPTPEPNCSASGTATSSATSSSSATSQQGQTLESILASINKNITPVTTCSGA